MKSMTNCIHEYEALLNQVVERREAVQNFDRFLRDKTAWLTSPASTRFHLAEDGGLLRHSVNVAQTLLKLRDIRPNYDLQLWPGKEPKPYLVNKQEFHFIELPDDRKAAYDMAERVFQELQEALNSDAEQNDETQRERLCHTPL